VTAEVEGEGVEVEGEEVEGGEVVGGEIEGGEVEGGEELIAATAAVLPLEGGNGAVPGMRRPPATSTSSL
jgi:hypothetical protein